MYVLQNSKYGFYKSKIWLLQNQNQNPKCDFYKIQIMDFTKFNINILLFVAKRYNFWLF